MISSIDRSGKRTHRLSIRLPIFVEQVFNQAIKPVSVSSSKFSTDVASSMLAADFLERSNVEQVW